MLFLSEAREAACWGPTVVVDQTPRSAPGQRAWLAPAICNCLVSFPGSLLHGVLPGALVSRQLGASIVSANIINPTVCYCFVSFPGGLLHGVLPGVLAGKPLMRHFCSSAQPVGVFVHQAPRASGYSLTS